MTQTEKILQDLNKQLRLKHNLENCKDKELCNQINKSLYKEIQENGHYTVLKAQAQTLLEAKKEEIEYLEHTQKSIELEIDLARKAKTNNGNQSIIILNMWLFWNRKRISSLKSDIKLLEGAK